MGCRGAGILSATEMSHVEAQRGSGTEEKTWNCQKTA